jgi:hypothetical protein
VPFLKRKQGSTIFLKGVVFLIGIAVLAVCIFALPGVASRDVAGILMLGFICLFASSVIATFAAILQKLLKDAIEIKLENDLTV